MSKFDYIDPMNGMKELPHDLEDYDRKVREALHARPESTRMAVIRLLWEKQFEGSPWADKFHLIRPDSLIRDYGDLADKIIMTVRGRS